MAYFKFVKEQIKSISNNMIGEVEKYKEDYKETKDKETFLNNYKGILNYTIDEFEDMKEDNKDILFKQDEEDLDKLIKSCKEELEKSDKEIIEDLEHDLEKEDQKVIKLDKNKCNKYDIFDIYKDTDLFDMCKDDDLFDILGDEENSIQEITNESEIGKDINRVISTQIDRDIDIILDALEKATSIVDDNLIDNKNYQFKFLYDMVAYIIPPIEFTLTKVYGPVYNGYLYTISKLIGEFILRNYKDILMDSKEYKRKTIDDIIGDFTKYYKFIKDLYEENPNIDDIYVNNRVKYTNNMIVLLIKACRLISKIERYDDNLLIKLDNAIYTCVSLLYTDEDYNEFNSNDKKIINDLICININFDKVKKSLFNAKINNETSKDTNIPIALEPELISSPESQLHFLVKASKSIVECYSRIFHLDEYISIDKQIIIEEGYCFISFLYDQIITLCQDRDCADIVNKSYLDAVNMLNFNSIQDFKHLLKTKNSNYVVKDNIKLMYDTFKDIIKIGAIYIKSKKYVLNIVDSAVVFISNSLSQYIYRSSIEEKYNYLLEALEDYLNTDQLVLEEILSKLFNESAGKYIADNFDLEEILGHHSIEVEPNTANHIYDLSDRNKVADMMLDQAFNEFKELLSKAPEEDKIDAINQVSNVIKNNIVISVSLCDDLHYGDNDIENLFKQSTNNSLDMFTRLSEVIEDEYKELESYKSVKKLICIIKEQLHCLEGDLVDIKSIIKCLSKYIKDNNINIEE